MISARSRQLIDDVVELAKVRMIPMVLITASYGYFLAHNPALDFRFFWMCFGFALISAGSATLNNYLDRDVDALMHRTAKRALPSGRVSPKLALVAGVTWVMMGVFVLVIAVNLLTAFLMLLASFLYVLVYTPLKRWSTWNTFVGAIPGAMPPLAGWTAATGHIDAVGIVLFLILFMWQHPHFYAIAIMHREDYARGGLKMLPVLDINGRRTILEIIITLVILVIVSIMPSVLGVTGWLYAAGAVVCGVYFVFKCVALIREFSVEHARSVFFASLVYLPLLLLFMVCDVVLL